MMLTSAVFLGFTCELCMCIVRLKVSYKSCIKVYYPSHILNSFSATALICKRVIAIHTPSVSCSIFLYFLLHFNLSY